MTLSFHADWTVVRVMVQSSEQGNPGEKRPREAQRAGQNSGVIGTVPQWRCIPVRTIHTHTPEYELSTIPSKPGYGSIASPQSTRGGRLARFRLGRFIPLNDLRPDSIWTGVSATALHLVH